MGRPEVQGVVLAGGKGTRLGLPYNKHKALVYDRMMIDYPLQTMEEMGAKPIIVSPLGETIKEGYLHLTQAEPLGMPDAIAQTEGFTSEVFPVLAGDVYFDPALEPSDRPTLYWHEFEGAENHSVWNPETNEVVEKPLRDIGRRAIVAYYFDQQVYNLIRQLKPSERGELEMTDIYRWYLEQGVAMKEYTGFFADMGTPDGLLRVANHVKEKQ